jgi:actin-like ATPase involved in cell morphogenesis
LCASPASLPGGITIKKEIGSAAPPADGIGVTIEIMGRDLLNGEPKAIEITQRHIAEASTEGDQVADVGVVPSGPP